MTLPDAIERTFIKLLRDFAVNFIVIAPDTIANGQISPELLLPTLGMAAYRTFRDVVPAAWKAV